MPDAPLNIVCAECGANTPVSRQPRYEGFTRVGDEFRCASCGHVYASEADLPLAEREAVRVFDASDKSDDVRVFGDDEKGCLCRYCRHYVVNPFLQRCGRHMKVVEATDSCNDFEASETAAESGAIQ